MNDTQKARSRRCYLRKKGYPVPKFRPGPVPPPFWDLVSKTESCWLWTGRVNRDGYGQYLGKMAHRISWKEAYGEIPAGSIVCHHCDTPNCVRPSHLFIGTQADNIKDKVSKKRQAIGEQAGRSKLTNAQAREIKYGSDSPKALARRFGISIHAISKIRTGVNWNWL